MKSFTKYLCLNLFYISQSQSNIEFINTIYSNKNTFKIRSLIKFLCNANNALLKQYHINLYIYYRNLRQSQLKSLSLLHIKYSY